MVRVALLMGFILVLGQVQSQEPANEPVETSAISYDEISGDEELNGSGNFTDTWQDIHPITDMLHWVHGAMVMIAIVFMIIVIINMITIAGLIYRRWKIKDKQSRTYWFHERDHQYDPRVSLDLEARDEYITQASESKRQLSNDRVHIQMELD